MKNDKPTVAFFDFTGCEGCQLTVIDSLQTHPELLEAIDIVEFREASSDQAAAFDIAFVEGSFARDRDAERLRDIRARAGLVVALGACAHLGGINAIRNLKALEEVRRYVYDGRAHWYAADEVRPISSVIEVDAVVPGCPIDREEFVLAVKMLLQGRIPQLPDYALCIECSLRENVCVYQRGQVCLGPITRAGCNAICPAFGQGCIGCRGLVANPQIDVLRDVMAEHGLTEEEIESRLTLFLTNQVDALEPEEVAHV